MCFSSVYMILILFDVSHLLTIRYNSNKFYSERKFAKYIKIFLQLYMIKTDLLTCY